ncbi:BZ3500_MvSof-1268-A1-R1_Chr7-2g09481 [Microbotryum saponariae]|uniref:BZ3500_MvSof-1268-A1-R1_Chr7-2g09481 protein n=1 Tax=Microbotryum saponariae TaxID=289078 RepID=A0A2X0N3U7_9BASI|nr:BZ3501_MvSof-1269-A2-R1_Chr7-1g09181 [Microbotryum saponariae]SDA02533.1 BZ3500_MvSof-1268-A1-R1_Chr7-2g09481 [Microbotryum saponariae]
MQDDPRLAPRPDLTLCDMLTIPSLKASAMTAGDQLGGASRPPQATPDALAERIRSLARSVGHEAVQAQKQVVQDHAHVHQQHYPSPDASPHRPLHHLSPPLSPSSASVSPSSGSISAWVPSSAGGNSLAPPAVWDGGAAESGAMNIVGGANVSFGAGNSSPTRPTNSSYPTPDGGSFLDEIIEEEAERTEDDAHDTQAPPVPPPASSSRTQSRRASRGSLFSTSSEDVRGVPELTMPDVARRSSRSAGLGFGSLKLYTTELEHESNLRSLLRDGNTFVVVPVALADVQLLVRLLPMRSGLFLPMRDTDPPKLWQVKGGAQSSTETTLSSTYIDPLVTVFRDEPKEFNEVSSASNDSPAVSSGTFFLHRRRLSNSSLNSSSSAAYLTARSPSHPFLLLLDIQTDPAMTIQFIRHALSPLLDAGLLTTYCPRSQLFTQAPITALITGEASRSQLLLEAEGSSESTRFLFVEADICSRELDRVEKVLSPVAGGDLGRAVGGWNRETLDEEQMEEVRRQVAQAKERGVKVRYEGLPKYPVHTRELLKSWLFEQGVDYF